MGFDKAALELGGRTLLERALASLRPLCDEVLLATGSTPRYLELGLPLVLDRASDLGPLAGLEAALEAARFERVLVIAVDMPAVESALLRQIAERAERDDCDVLLLASAAGVEPLCGAYHTRVAPAVRAALDADERRMTAVFRHPLSDGRPPRLEVLDAEPLGHARALANVNTSADLVRARAEFGAATVVGAASVVGAATVVDARGGGDFAPEYAHHEVNS